MNTKQQPKSKSHVKQAVAAPAPAAPTSDRVVFRGKIARITPEPERLVITIRTEKDTYEYFSVVMTSPDSIRIGSQQLRNAFPELAPVANPLLHVLKHRNEFINMDVEYSVTVRLDKVTKQPVINPKSPTHQPFTNVRLEASSKALSDGDISKLYPMMVATAAATEDKGEQLPDDIPGL